MNRRSPTTRKRNGKRIEITDRDVAIFSALTRYRYLRSTYVHAFAGGASKKRFQERLGHLFHEGFLGRPRQQWRFADARYTPAVYEIDKCGAQALAERQASETPPATFLASGQHIQFEHSQLVCSALASIELASRNRPDLRFIAWPEILAKAPEETRRAALPQRLSLGSEHLIPDAIFGLEYRVEDKRSYRFFALEIDRATMPITRAAGRQTSLGRKLNAYRQVISQQLYKSVWGVPNLVVLFLTTSERHLANGLRAIDPGWPETPAFLFKRIDPDALREPSNSLLGLPWARSGQTPMTIADAQG